MRNSSVPDVRDDLAGPEELRAALAVAALAELNNASRRNKAAAGTEHLLDAADASIESVVKDAHRTRKRTGVDFEDLRQEAAVAVLAAVKTWDPQSHPSWTAYAAASAKHRVAEILDRDESGRGLTRATSRMLRHARAVRLSAEARGEHPDVVTIVGDVLEANAARAAERGADPEVTMRRSGELAALAQDIPYLLAEGAPVRFDAPLEEGGDTYAEVISTHRETTNSAVCDLFDLISVEERAELLGGGRISTARGRVVNRLNSPHQQWAMLGTAPKTS